MAAGKVYKVPAYNLEWLKGKVAKLTKKAQKLTGAKIYMTVVGFTDEKQNDGSYLRFWEVFIAGDEPKLNGWEFLARVSHHVGGNILRVVPGAIIPETHRETSCYCDHCNITRYRRDTFIVKHETTGEIKQVGSACLKDFLGHRSPEQIAKYAELLCDLEHLGNDRSNHDEVGRDWRYVSQYDLLFSVAVSVGRFGWMSRKMHDDLIQKLDDNDHRAISKVPNPSSSEALSMMFDRDYFHHHPVITDEEKKVAYELVDKAIEYFNTNVEPKTDKSDYEHNLSVLMKNETLEMREVGMVASVIGLYLRSLPKPDTVNYKISSNHMGNIGDKVAYTAKVLGKTSFQGAFGPTTVYKFDVDGNVVSAFVTGKFFAEIGETVKIKGTVKKHDIYKDVKQTVLTRLSVAK